jgi:type II secretory pathway pseudopilin PulG
MPDIYLHLEGQQTGPYQLAQVRQLVAEGKLSTDTPAWYQGLSAWGTVASVLAAFPVTGVPPVSIPPPPPPPVRQGMNGCALAAIIVCAVFGGIFVLSCLAGIALGPITNGIKKAKENMAMQQARGIELAMFAYATDNNGAYPDGKTSTEVFQKLIDGKYISDPGIFYVAMPGKIKATSDKLTADNVCYDVTSGVAADSSDGLPVVFSTGYSVTYSAGASATRDPGILTAFPGIDVAYKSNSARFIQAGPDGEIPDFIPANFDPGNKTYQQLRP